MAAGRIPAGTPPSTTSPTVRRFERDQVAACDPPSGLTCSGWTNLPFALSPGANGLPASSAANVQTKAYS
ncbi:MAG: hypothetical protein ACK55Z_04440, partial [bacterium]